ncbi:uncharacterized protein LOC119069426 [Bradysia coprophila]|uniref:uncharacterized protein LOC119069426 n=1 Tax=Bradysia coprophila TaxID=38358 RepID=UPI00187DCECB|nr:uncharacterized protein LOC119069426 [Bradysia coprophila]
MKYLIVLIFLGIVIESMIVTGQRSNSNSDNVYDEPSATVKADDSTIGYRRPTNNFNGRFKKVLKVKKERPNLEPIPVGKRLNRTPNSEDSVSASSNKNSFTVSNYDDNDDYFSRRRARFLFRQRVGK